MTLYEIIKLLTHPGKIKIILEILELVKIIIDKIKELDDDDTNKQKNYEGNKVIKWEPTDL